MKGYYQRDIYLCLVRRGPLTTIELTHLLGLPYRAGMRHPSKSGAQIIFKMKRAGLVERVARGWQIVPGTRPPRCMRGRTAGSLLALRSHARNNMARLHAKKGQHMRPVATTALEQAWGWLPSVSPIVDAANDACCSTGSLPATISSTKPG